MEKNYIEHVSETFANVMENSHILVKINVNLVVIYSLFVWGKLQPQIWLVEKKVQTSTADQKIVH